MKRILIFLAVIVLAAVASAQSFSFRGVTNYWDNVHNTWSISDCTKDTTTFVLNVRKWFPIIPGVNNGISSFSRKPIFANATDSLIWRIHRCTFPSLDTLDWLQSDCVVDSLKDAGAGDTTFQIWNPVIGDYFAGYWKLSVVCKGATSKAFKMVLDGQ